MEKSRKQQKCGSETDDIFFAVDFAEDLMEKFPRAEDYPYKSWSYPQGYLLMGMAKIYERTGDEKYYKYIYEYGDLHVQPWGEVDGFTGCSMDDMMTGAVLLWLYQQSSEERFALACHKIYASFADYPRTREGGYLHDRFRYPGEMWVDGVFMGQMFYCRYGMVFHKKHCFQETINQLKLIHNYCFAHDGMLVHGYSQDHLAAWSENDGKSSSIWSEGLGWYGLILSEAVELLRMAKEDGSVPEQYLKELLYGLKKYQNPKDGLWFQVVDKPEDGRNWTDTSGSGMFLYTIIKGILLKVVEEEEFIPVVHRAYLGLRRRVRKNPKTGHFDVSDCCNGLCVQNREEDYYFYPQTINAQEAVCSVLWGMEATENFLKDRREEGLYENICCK